MDLQHRAACLLSLVSLCLAGCQAPPVQQPPEPGKSIEISGRLLTARGDAPALAHVHVGSPGVYFGIQDAQSITEVADDGSFALTVRDDGTRVLALALTALHHEPATIPLILGAGTDRVELEMTLQAHRVVEQPSVVRIEGDLDAEMERRDDGTWSYTTEDLEESLSYRVRMGGIDVREIDGTQADRYEPESYGYRAVIEAASGPVEIVFDPGRVPPRGENLPRLSTDHEPLARAFALKKAEDVAAEEAKKRSMAGEKPDFGELYAAVRDHIEQALGSEDSPALRAYAAARSLKIPGDSTPEEMERTLAELPADSHFWNLVGVSVQRLDSQRHGELLDALRSHPDPAVAAHALVALIKSAKAAGEKERWRLLYAELEEAVPTWKNLLTSLDPDPRIAVGKPVPDFELELFESTFEGRDTVSKADLSGRVYLIDFWGTWCVPCLKEIPKIREVWEKYREQNFQVLSVAYENSPEVVRDFMKRESMPWLHHYVKLDYGGDPPILETFEVTNFPKPILVGADGTILAVDNLKGEQIMETVGRAMAE